MKTRINATAGAMRHWKALRESMGEEAFKELTENKKIALQVTAALCSSMNNIASAIHEQTIIMASLLGLGHQPQGFGLKAPYGANKGQKRGRYGHR